MVLYRKSGIFRYVPGSAGYKTTRVERPEWFYTPPGPRTFRNLQDFSAQLPSSAELKGPRKLVRIWTDIFDFEPQFRLKRSQTKPKIPGTVPTDRHTTISNDYGPISACFHDGPPKGEGFPRGSRGWCFPEEFLRVRGGFPRGVPDPLLEARDLEYLPGLL
jgi:hypothetical protein